MTTIYGMYIFAQADDNNWVRYGIILVAIVIWLIQAAAGAVHKRQEDPRRERLRRELERSSSTTTRVGPPPVPRAPAPPRRQPPPPMRAPARPQQQRSQPQPPRRATAKAKPRPAPVRVPPLPHAAQIVAPQISTAATLGKIAPAITGPSRKRPTAASAGDVARWLNPATLRRQFILTEILQPPVAMREDHLSG